MNEKMSLIQTIIDNIILKNGFDQNTCEQFINEYIDHNKIEFDSVTKRKELINRIIDHIIVTICTEMNECNELVKLYSNLIYAIIQKLLIKNGKPAKNDVVDDYRQEVFFQLFNKRKKKLIQYDSEKGSLKNWIAIITTSTVLNLFKRKDPINHPTMPLDNLLDLHDNKEKSDSIHHNNQNNLNESIQYNTIDSIHHKMIVEKIMNKISDNEKKIFIGIYLEKSSKELAEELELKPGTIDNIKSKLKKKIKILLIVLTICDKNNAFRQLEQNAKDNTIDQLVNIIQEMDDLSIQVIMLYYFMDKSIIDIANLINISKETIKNIKSELLERINHTILENE